jgi:polar amino acid transport system substrate-binding protein
MLALALLALLAAPATEPEALRVGMDTRSRPWAFVPGLDYFSEDFAAPPRVSAAQLQQLVGVDIDILEALATRLGVKTRVVPVVWEGIEEGLLDKKYDLIMNAWVPSTKTPAGVVASSPYNEWGLLVVVRADDTALRSFTDLAGKVVGHFEDASVDRSVISLRPGKRVPFEDSDALFAALAKKELDAAVEDSTFARWRVAHDPAFRIVGGPLNRVGYHLGVRREDKALLVRIEAAIKDLRASGELARIKKRWESPEAPGR